MTIKHYILDAKTGETLEIELTAEEIAARKLAAEELKNKQLQEEQTKLETKSALLERLGITAEEATLLLG
jgi:hypothetical protein